MANNIEDINKARPGHNGYDPDKLKAFVDRAENIQSEIDGVMQAAKEECSPLRDDMKDVKSDACDSLGISKSVFNAYLRERRLSNQVLAVRTKLDENHQESLDQVRHALGGLAGLPLGKAVLDETKAA